jgi:pimeloyl-ACP methyl ester carboxylesterase
MRRGFMDGIKTDPRATYGDLRACRAWDDRARLKEIGAPCLVVRGADELPEVAEAASRLAAMLPNAREVVIPDAGHLLPVEQPEALAAAVLSFLEELRV